MLASPAQSLAKAGQYFQEGPLMEPGTALEERARQRSDSPQQAEAPAPARRLPVWLLGLIPLVLIAIAVGTFAGRGARGRTDGAPSR